MILTDFYTALREVGFPQDHSAPFDEMRAQRLVEDYTLYRPFISVKGLSLDSLREWHREWTTSETTQTDSGMRQFLAIANCLELDIASENWEIPDTLRLLQLWLVGDAEG